MAGTGFFEEDHVVVYVLELRNGKFYVGRTREGNVKTRIDAHRAGNGAAWTRKHGVRDFVEVQKHAEPLDEDKTVLRYMEEHGVHNVRGGSWSNVTLSMEQHVAALRQLRNASDACLACGKYGHFVQHCDTVMCFRCGRAGHDVASCYAKTHACSGALDGCYRCGRPEHWAWRCNRSKDVFGRPLDSVIDVTQCAVS